MVLTPYGVYWQGTDGHFFAGPDGIAGEWAGTYLDPNPLQLAKFRQFFTGNVGILLIDLAGMWTNEEWDGEEEKIPTPLSLSALVNATVVLQRRLLRRFTYDETHEIIMDLLTDIENDLGIMAYHELPALEAVWDANHPEYVAERERDAAAAEGKEPPPPPFPPIGEPLHSYDIGFRDGRRDMLEALIRNIDEAIEGKEGEERSEGILDGIQKTADELRPRKRAA